MQKRLPGLNGLRAIAASWILFGHTYQIAGLVGYSEGEKIYLLLFHNWFDPVNLFFVISGFIITFLLLKEKAKTKTVNLKAFYLKRFFRIWPLYFLILLIVFILSNYTTLYSGFGGLNLSSIAIISLFLVTLNSLWNAPLSVLPHYWSLSVEEQFYLFWPALLKKFDILKICLCVIIILIVLRNGSAYISHIYKNSIIFLSFNSYLVASKFSSMAIGGLGAYFTLQKRPICKDLQKKIIKYPLWILFFMSFLIKLYIPYINSEVQSILFVMLIMIVVQSPTMLLDNKFVDLTGRISYGVYMYQWPIIPLIILVLKSLHIDLYFSAGYFVPLLLLCYFIVFALSYVSYFYFESIFLRLKSRF
jgi:peptidoglycan/LPS O-acetylase OafA/YrhL